MDEQINALLQLLEKISSDASRVEAVYKYLASPTDELLNSIDQMTFIELGGNNGPDPGNYTVDEKKEIIERNKDRLFPVLNEDISKLSKHVQELSSLLLANNDN